MRYWIEAAPKTIESIFGFQAGFQAQPGLLRISDQQTITFQAEEDPGNDAVEQGPQGLSIRCGHVAEALLAMRRHEYSVHGEHVQVNIEIHRTSKSLTQRHDAAACARFA